MLEGICQTVQPIVPVGGQISIRVLLRNFIAITVVREAGDPGSSSGSEPRRFVDSQKLVQLIVRIASGETWPLGLDDPADIVIGIVRICGGFALSVGASDLTVASIIVIFHVESAAVA